MRAVLRWTGIVIASALVIPAVLWPLLLRPPATEAGPPDDPVVITDYRADLHVDGRGTLEATETVTARFPSA